MTARILAVVIRLVLSVADLISVSVTARHYGHSETDTTMLSGFLVHLNRSNPPPVVD